MRKLKIDFNRAIEIKERSDAAHELRRTSGEKLRHAKRRVDDAQREIDIWAANPGDNTVHARGDGKANRLPSFVPGLAAHNLRQQELADAQELFARANERHSATSAEAAYWGSINSACRTYLTDNFRNEALPTSLREEEY